MAHGTRGSAVVTRSRRWIAAPILAVTSFLIGGAPRTAVAWEPTRPVEFVIPAGTGGGADVMARFIAPMIEKYKLSPRPFVVVNKSGGAGAEAFLYVKSKAKDPHVIIITLDNLFTTPIATGVPFNWRDLTPVARMALDYFVLWVNAESPYKTAAEYLEAVKKEPRKFVMAGTGTAQEDQIITVMMEQAFGVKFSYVPFKGGGDVAVGLVGNHASSSVNNPAEAVSHWKAGRLRPLAAIDGARIDLPDWKGIPTMKEATGQDLSYQMLRGIFTAPGITAEQQAFYVNVFKKVSETPEWKKYVSDMGLKPAFLSGPDYVKWLEQKEAKTRDLMKAGSLVKQG